jgi:P27 family predicted phage terminase small subunit
MKKTQVKPVVKPQAAIQPPQVKENKYTAIRKLINNYLTDKGIIEKVDSTLINELIFNYKVADMAKQNIVKNGVMINVVRDPTKEPLYQVNGACNVYNTSLKTVMTILTKLSITPQERNKLGLVSKAEKSDFETEFE